MLSLPVRRDSWKRRGAKSIPAASARVGKQALIGPVHVQLFYSCRSGRFRLGRLLVASGKCSSLWRQLRFSSLPAMILLFVCQTRSCCCCCCVCTFSCVSQFLRAFTSPSAFKTPETTRAALQPRTRQKERDRDEHLRKETLLIVSFKLRHRRCSKNSTMVDVHQGDQRLRLPCSTHHP